MVQWIRSVDALQRSGILRALRMAEWTHEIPQASAPNAAVM